MPRRLVTSEFFRNDKVAELDYVGRLFFIGLITNADDEGRIKGAAKYLKATIFPYDDIPINKIEEYRKRCHELNLIQYYSVNGLELILLPGWLEHQQIRKDRFRKSKLPPPDNHLSTDGMSLDNHLSTDGMLNISKVNISKVNIGVLKKYPPHFIELRKQVFEGLKNRRNYVSRQPAAEAKAISQMLEEGFKPEQILEAYDLIKTQPFFTDKSLSMMQVRKEIHEVLKGGKLRRSPRAVARPEDYTKPEDL